MGTTDPRRALPLFPLQTVLFPGALLGLRVFEARYIDLVGACMRSGEPFGVVCLLQGREAGPGPRPVRFETVGVTARIDRLDAEQAGILSLRCAGLSRFRIVDEPWQQDNGQWLAHAQRLADDPPRHPAPAMLATVSALAEAIRKLKEGGRLPFAEPFRLDDAGWVANRWCELLPVPLAAKQKLMELEDPAMRLSIVDGYLRDKKVVVD